MHSSLKIHILANGNRVKNIKPLNEEAAVSQGAEFLGLFVVYVFSASTIAYEIRRNNRNSSQRIESEEYHRSEIQRNLNELKREINELGNDILLVKQTLNEINFDGFYWLRQIEERARINIKNR